MFSVLGRSFLCGQMASVGSGNLVSALTTQVALAHGLDWSSVSKNRQTFVDSASPKTCRKTGSIFFNEATPIGHVS